MQCLFDGVATARRKLLRMGSFAAVAEDKREFRIYVFQPSALYGMEWFEGKTELLTRDGEAVKYIAKGQFEVLQVYEQVPVMSYDPRAP